MQKEPFSWPFIISFLITGMSLVFGVVCIYHPLDNNNALGRKKNEKWNNMFF